MGDINSQIRDRIESFVNELGELVRQAALESVKQALSGEPAPAPRSVTPRRSPAPTSPAPRKKGGKRSAEQLEALTSDILTYVSANPGQGVEMIAKGLGTDTKELTLPIKKLLQTGQLSTEGQKRATKYFPAGTTAEEEPEAAPRVRRRKAKTRAKRRTR